MKTPVYDFVKKYGESESVRLHMPGHKGVGPLGAEIYDITEITGADCLSDAKGIIAESERNASLLFGCPTFYSTEGSSLAVRAMLFLVKKHTEITANRQTKILAGRNSHRSFMQTAALLDIDVDWINGTGDYESCEITPGILENYLKTNSAPDALFVTSPDYSGNITDIKALSAFCRLRGILLLVDCAHGAYLKFLKESLHPSDLGADLVCCSAHKTLPVLTGGAYLHVSSPDKFFAENAKEALSLFATTSPSYLILSSLDLCNDFLENASKTGLFNEAGEMVLNIKNRLTAKGIKVTGDECLKLTVRGRGIKIGELLENEGIYPEYAGEKFIVLMFSPFNAISELLDVGDKLIAIYEKHPELFADSDSNTVIPVRVKAMTLNEALYKECETVDISESEGRVLARPLDSCPPCIPLFLPGEVLGKEVLGMGHFPVKVVKGK